MFFSDLEYGDCFQIPFVSNPFVYQKIGIDKCIAVIEMVVGSKEETLPRFLRGHTITLIGLEQEVQEVSCFSELSHYYHVPKAFQLSKKQQTVMRNSSGEFLKTLKPLEFTKQFWEAYLFTDRDLNLSRQLGLTMYWLID